MTPDTNRFARWTLLAAFLLAFTAAPAQAQLGIAGGLNFESAGDIEIQNAEGTLDNSTAYHIGVVYDLSLGPAAIRPGIFYRKVGDYEFSASQVAADVQSFSLSTVEVPIDVRFTVLPTPVISPYVLGGPQISFPQGEDDFGEATENVSFSLNVGVGAELSLPGLPIALQPELRYEFGATKFIKDDFEIGGTEFNPQDEPRFNAFALRLNVIF